MNAEGKAYRYQSTVFMGHPRRTVVTSLVLHGLFLGIIVFWPYLRNLFGGRTEASIVLDVGGGGGGGGLGESIGVELTGGLPSGDDYTKPPLKPLEPPAPVPTVAPVPDQTAVEPEAAPAEETPPAPVVKTPPRPDDHLIPEPVRPEKREVRKPKPDKKVKTEPPPPEKPAKPLEIAKVPPGIPPRLTLPEGSAAKPEGVRKTKGGYGGDDLAKTGVGSGAGSRGGGTGGGSGGGAGGGTGVSVGPGRGPGSGLGDSYFSRVERRIGDNWLGYLGSEFKGTHHVSVEMTIRKDGFIESYTVLEEDLKASEAFIRSVKGAVERSRRLIPFPDSIRSDKVKVTVFFDFPFRN